MTTPHYELQLPEVAALLSIERELVAESDELKERALTRAREAIPRGFVRSFDVPSRRARTSVALAGALSLAALCAAAFVAGYRVNLSPSPRPAASAAGAPAVAAPVPQNVAAVGVAETAPATLDGLPSQPETTVPKRGAPPAKAKGGAKAAVDIEILAEELQVLRPARQAVASQDFTTALGAIAEHQRRFPGGRLAEEREALRIKSLLALGRTAEAQRAGNSFRTRFPRSALLGRINEMLGTEK